MLLGWICCLLGLKDARWRRDSFLLFFLFLPDETNSSDLELRMGIMCIQLYLRNRLTIILVRSSLKFICNVFLKLLNVVGFFNSVYFFIIIIRTTPKLYLKIKLQMEILLAI